MTSPLPFCTPSLAWVPIPCSGVCLKPGLDFGLVSKAINWCRAAVDPAAFSTTSVPAGSDAG